MDIGQRALRQPAHMWGRLQTQTHDLPVTLRNISTSGAYVLTKNAFGPPLEDPFKHGYALGELGLLKVRSDRSRIEVELPCKVARTEKHGVGVQFDQPPEPTKLWLENYCAPHKDQPRIVMVDDEGSLLAMMDIFLSAAGFRFYGIDIPVGSEEVIRRFNPAMIILDIHMPVIDGPTLAKNLATAHVNVPILYHSAAQIEVARELIGDAPFLGKGARRAEIVAEIRKLLDKPSARA